jgi:hypothetical protein
MRSAARVAVLPVAILALAACGSPSPDGAAPRVAASAVADGSYPGRSAQEVLDAARTAAARGKAVTVTGSTSSAAQKITFTLSQVNGKGVVGVLAVDGAGLKVRQVGETVFAQPSADFLATLGPMGASLGTTFGSRWIAADPVSLKSLGIFSSDAVLEPLERFHTTGSALDTTVPADATLERVPGITVEGVPTTGIRFTAPMPAETATQITSAGGTPPATLTGTVYVAAGGKAYPLAMTNNAGLDVTLSDWGKPADVTAPAAKQTVPLSKLGF